MTLKSDVRGEVTTKLRQLVNNNVFETKIFKMCFTAATFILLLFGLQFSADQVAMQQRCSFLWVAIFLWRLSLCARVCCRANISKTFQKPDAGFATKKQCLK